MTIVDQRFWYCFGNKLGEICHLEIIVFTFFLTKRFRLKFINLRIGKIPFLIAGYFMNLMNRQKFHCNFLWINLLILVKLGFLVNLKKWVESTNQTF